MRERTAGLHRPVRFPRDPYLSRCSALLLDRPSSSVAKTEESFKAHRGPGRSSRTAILHPFALVSCQAGWTTLVDPGGGPGRQRLSCHAELATTADSVPIRKVLVSALDEHLEGPLTPPRAVVRDLLGSARFSQEGKKPPEFPVRLIAVCFRRALVSLLHGGGSGSFDILRWRLGSGISLGSEFEFRVDAKSFESAVTPAARSRNHSSCILNRHHGADLNPRSIGLAGEAN